LLDQRLIFNKSLWSQIKLQNLQKIRERSFLETEKLLTKLKFSFYLNIMRLSLKREENFRRKDRLKDVLLDQRLLTIIQLLNMKVQETKMKLCINQNQRVGLRTRNSSQLMILNTKRTKRTALLDLTSTILHLWVLFKRVVMLSKSEESTKPLRECKKLDKLNLRKNLWLKEVFPLKWWPRLGSQNKLWASHQLRASLRLLSARKVLQSILKSKTYRQVSPIHKESIEHYLPRWKPLQNLQESQFSRQILKLPKSLDKISSSSSQPTMWITTMSMSKLISSRTRFNNSSNSNNYWEITQKLRARTNYSNRLSMNSSKKSKKMDIMTSTQKK